METMLQEYKARRATLKDADKVRKRARDVLCEQSAFHAYESAKLECKRQRANLKKLCAAIDQEWPDEVGSVMFNGVQVVLKPKNKLALTKGYLAPFTGDEVLRDVITANLRDKREVEPMFVKTA